MTTNKPKKTATCLGFKNGAPDIINGFKSYVSNPRTLKGSKQ